MFQSNKYPYVDILYVAIRIIQFVWSMDEILGESLVCSFATCLNLTAHISKTLGYNFPQNLR